MATATITLRMDKEEKNQLDKLLNSMGMTIASFYSIYTKKALSERRIPFEVTANDDVDAHGVPYAKYDASDPFWSKENQKALDESERQIRAGEVVAKSMNELESLTRG